MPLKRQPLDSTPEVTGHMGHDVLLLLIGALATGGVAAVGYLIKRRIEHREDPVEKFIKHHELLLKSQATSTDSKAIASSTIAATVTEIHPSESFQRDLAFTPHMTQAEMNRRSYEMADVELLEVQQLASTLKRMLKEEEVEVFAESQSAWLRYADLQARLATAPFKGGTIVPTIYNTERASLAQARAADLKRIVDAFNL